jgi:hypothetical protein
MIPVYSQDADRRNQGPSGLVATVERSYVSPVDRLLLALDLYAAPGVPLAFFRESRFSSRKAALQPELAYEQGSGVVKYWLTRMPERGEIKRNGKQLTLPTSGLSIALETDPDRNGAFYMKGSIVAHRQSLELKITPPSGELDVRIPSEESGIRVHKVIGGLSYQDIDAFSTMEERLTGMRDGRPDFWYARGAEDVAALLADPWTYRALKMQHYNATHRSTRFTLTERSAHFLHSLLSRGGRSYHDFNSLRETGAPVLQKMLEIIDRFCAPKSCFDIPLGSTLRHNV